MLQYPTLVSITFLALCIVIIEIIKILYLIVSARTLTLRILMFKTVINQRIKLQEVSHVYLVSYYLLHILFINTQTCYIPYYLE